MSGNIQENIDFDGDLSFSGKDLDISWAYLQVKALLDSGSSDVTVSNFRDKVIEQYNLNKSAGIAEPNDKEITSLPGKLSLGLPKGIDQVIFVKKWTLNDMFNNNSNVGDRSQSTPTDIYESQDAEIAGTISNPNWISSKGVTSDRLLSFNGDTILNLEDGGAIRNDKSWTLHFKFSMNNSYLNTDWQSERVVLVSKGYDMNTFTDVPTLDSDMKNDPAMAVVLYPSAKKIGFYAGDGVRNWFVAPFLNKSNLVNKDIDFYIIRSGQNISFGADLNDGVGVRMATQEIVGALPTIVNMEKLNHPLSFSAQTYVDYVDDIWIADNELKEDDVRTIVPPAKRLKFAHEMDLDSSYFAFKNLFQDKFGNYARIFRKNPVDDPATPEGALEDDQSHFTTEHTSDGTKYGFRTNDRSKVLKLKAEETLDVFNLNGSGNFTISFWARTDHRGFIMQLKNSNGDGYAFGPSWKADHNVLKVNSLQTQNWFNGDVKDISSEWVHYTLVKNRNLLGLWTNEKIGDWNYLHMSDSEIDKIGFSTFKLLGASSPTYFADVRVADYALSHIPAQGYGKRTSYWSEFIGDLKKRDADL